MGQEQSTPTADPQALVEKVASAGQEISKTVSTSFSVSSRRKTGDGKGKLNVALLHETLAASGSNSRNSRKYHRLTKDGSSIATKSVDDDSPLIPPLSILLQDSSGEHQEAKFKPAEIPRTYANEGEVEVLFGEIVDQNPDLYQKFKLKYASDGASVTDISYNESVPWNTTDFPSLFSDTAESFLTDVAHCPGATDGTATSRDRRLYFRRLYEEQESLRKLELLTEIIKAQYDGGADSCSSSKESSTVNDKDEGKIPSTMLMTDDMIEQSRSNSASCKPLQNNIEHTETPSQRSNQDETVDASMETKNVDNQNKHATIPKPDWDDGSNVAKKSLKQSFPCAEPDWDTGSRPPEISLDTSPDWDRGSSENVANEGGPETMKSDEDSQISSHESEMKESTDSDLEPSAYTKTDMIASGPNEKASSKSNLPAFSPYNNDEDASKDSVKSISWSVIDKRVIGNSSDEEALVLFQGVESSSTRSNVPAGHNTSVGDSAEIFKNSFDWSDKKSSMSIAEINDDDSDSDSEIEEREILISEKRSNHHTREENQKLEADEERIEEREMLISEKQSNHHTREENQKLEADEEKNDDKDSDEEGESTGSEDEDDDEVSESTTPAPDYYSLFGDRSSPCSTTTKTSLKIKVHEPSRPCTRSEPLNIFHQLDNPTPTSTEDGDIDVRFVEQYEDLFQEFLYEKPQLMDRDPELLGYLKVLKLQKILQASVNAEKNLQKKIGDVEHQRAFMSKSYHSQLMEASQKKARREMELEQEVTQIAKNRKAMQANLTWKRIAATDVRAKRQQRILSNLAEQKANADSVMALLPEIPETKLLKDFITSSGEYLSERTTKDLVHYQVDNALLLAETRILDCQSQAMFENAKRHAWVDSIFLRMNDDHMKQLKNVYDSKAGLKL